MEEQNKKSSAKEILEESIDSVKKYLGEDPGDIKEDKKNGGSEAQGDANPSTDKESETLKEKTFGNKKNSKLRKAENFDDEDFEDDDDEDEDLDDEEDLVDEDDDLDDDDDLDEDDEDDDEENDKGKDDGNDAEEKDNDNTSGDKNESFKKLKKLSPLALVLSFIPGLGQIYAGKTKRGFIVFSIYSAILISVIFFPYVVLVCLLFEVWNLYDAWKMTDKYNENNGYSKSIEPDKLQKYGIVEKIIIGSFKYVIIPLFKAILFILAVFVSIMILPIRIAIWIYGKIYRCPHCGKDNALSCIDERVIDRSNSYTKYDKSRQKYFTYENVVVEKVYKCEYCGGIVRSRRKKRVALDE